MTFYNFYVFDRHCKCVYYTSWHRSPGSAGGTVSKVPIAVPSGSTSVRTSSSGPALAPPGGGTSRFAKSGGISLDEEAKLVYGVIYSLRNMVNKLKGTSEMGSFLAYKTNAYKLHYFETATGLKFVLNTDPNTENLSHVLRTIYSQMYVEYVAKNPLARSTESIANDLFKQSVDRYVATLPGFQ